MSLKEEEHKELSYLLAVMEAIGRKPASIARWLTNVCPECGEHIVGDRHHKMLCDAVVVGCEGYWIVNPNAVGIPSPNWCDWTERSQDNG